MKKKDENDVDNFQDAFSSVSHASGLRLLLVIARKRNMHTDHVDISQAFTQGDLVPRGHGSQAPYTMRSRPPFTTMREFLIAPRLDMRKACGAKRPHYHSCSSY
jgi:hypothetical protein